MAGRTRRGGLLIIIVALILLLLVGAAYLWLQMQGGLPGQAQPLPTPAPQDLVDIVVTTQFIARGSEIVEGAVTTIPYPRDKLVAGTFITDLQSVYGKRAKYDLERGIPLTPGVLLELEPAQWSHLIFPKNTLHYPSPSQASHPFLTPYNLATMLWSLDVCCW